MAPCSKPDGAGPFPGVVLLHGCGGIRPHFVQWATGRCGIFRAPLLVLIGGSDDWTPAKKCEDMEARLRLVNPDAQSLRVQVTKVPTMTLMT
jgi:dienelactone hydrolase